MSKDVFYLLLTFCMSVSKTDPMYEGIFVKSIQKPQVWADCVTNSAHIGILVNILIQGVDNF